MRISIMEAARESRRRRRQFLFLFRDGLWVWGLNGRRAYGGGGVP